MVRETRHLWVGNLPDNIREDRIRDHFKRYGRVQSVKLLGGRGEKDEVCATVSFMDIKSAAKAHHSEQKLDERVLTTEYHEPAAIPAPNYSRFHLGSEELSSSFDRSSHFYDREGAGGYIRRSGSYHTGGESLSRKRARDRAYRNGPYTPIIESVVSRSGGNSSHHGSSRSGTWTYDSPSPRYPPSTPDISYQEPAPIIVHKKHSKSRSGSDSGSNSSRSRSSSASSQSGSSTCSTASSSPASEKSCSTHHSQQSNIRSSGAQSNTANHTNSNSPAVHSEDRRPLAICVRNLPARSSDTSLKDGLYHEYKKHGKVTWVKVVGQGVDRYALVSFKKPEDVDKALQVSHDKLFFGCKIEVAPYQGYDVDDNEFRPFEAEQDEFHPKATRTLFIGNLDKDITTQEIRKHFDQFGEIIDIDIKKQGTSSSYAFCQFSDIGSVVRAMRSLDGEHVGGNRVKLGFGKSMHTSCVWVDGVTESVSEKYLSQQFGQFGPISHVIIDRARGQALVSYEQITYAQQAVKEMRGAVLRGKKLQVDYASRECQESFYDHMEKQSTSSSHPPFENSSSSVAGSPQNLRVFESPSSSSTAPCTGSGGSVTSRYNSCSRYSSSRSNSYNRSSSPTRSRHSSSRFQDCPSSTLGQEYERRSSYRSYEDVTQVEESNTPNPGTGDIRHLQKERVSLLEQLEDCTSSGEEGTNRRRCNKHRRSQSGEGSRPGTPLCDERPENLGPVEPRRPRESRPPDPLSLPLPRFASQVLSPRPAPPSPPASPQTHSSSSDSEPSPEWEERLRSLDEKYEKWSSGSRAGLTKVDLSTLKVRHKLLELDLHELQPSEIVKSLLAKRSVFDEDSKRLENFGEKYEPREFVPARSSLLRGRLDLSPMSSPVVKSPSSPAAKGLQYPFPSHPPVQPTTSVATTTAPTSTTVTVATTEIKPSATTFLTNCTPARQFPLPKISSPQAEKCEANLRLSCTKALPPVTTVAKPSVVVPCKPIPDIKKEQPPPPILTKVKSNAPIRRESSDDKKEETRRKSRDESIESVKSLDSVKREDTSECDKVRDSQITERRKSVSEKRRSSAEHKESICERTNKDASDKRRGSSETDSETARKNENKKVFEENHLEIPKLLSEPDKIRKGINDSSERRKETESNIRPICDQEKKRDVFGVNSEKDRRRNRESVEISDNPKQSKKVPDNKKEVDALEKRDKDEDIKTVESDKKKETSDQSNNQHINRHKEKKDHMDRRRDSSEHSEKKSEKINQENPEVHRIKDKKVNHDISDIRNSKKQHEDSEAKIEVIKHKDSERRKNSDNEISKEHSLFKKVFGFAERTYGHHKDRRDSDSTAVKTDDTIKHRRDHSEKERKRDKDPDQSESTSKHKSRKSPDQPENNRHKDRKRSESSEKRIRKEYDQSDDHKQKSDHIETFHSKSRERKEDRSSKDSSKGLFPSEHLNEINAFIKHNDRRKDSSLDESRNSESDSNDLKLLKDGDSKKDSEVFFERRKEDGAESRSKVTHERRKDIVEKYLDDKCVERIKRDDSDLDKKNDSSSEVVKYKHERHRDSDRKRDHIVIENCRNKEQKDEPQKDEVIKHKEERKSESDLFDCLKSKDDNYRYRDYSRKKENETQDHIRISDKKKEEKDKKKEREFQDSLFKVRDSDDKCEREIEKIKRSKELDLSEGKVNGDHDEYGLDNIDCRKPNFEEEHSIKKEKRKDKSSWPATIGCKRRLSSQDSLEIVEDAKRSKPERRDSKDSGRSSGSSRKSSSEKHKGFTKLLEEKIKEDKEREQRKKEDLIIDSNSQCDDKILKPAIRKEKRNSGEKRKEERKFKNRLRENGTASESDLCSGDEENKANKRQHSIFDIVDDEPAYISMYDKVKARSTKNMQKQEEEKRQEKLKEKFHQLKASRAKREEKKRSTSYDEDSDSEKGGGGRRSNKLLITSSDDEACSENDVRVRTRKILCDTSEDDSVNTPRSRLNKYSDYETKSSRKIISDVSEDDSVMKHSTPKIKSSRNISFESDIKTRKIMSDTSEDDSTRQTTPRQKPSRIQSDDSEGDLGFEDSIRPEPISVKTFLEPTIKITDVFASRPVEMNHFTNNDLEQKQHPLQSSPEPLRRVSLDSVSSEQPRKKSHKKKTKKKNYEVSEDGTIIVRKHSSKKEKKKSHRDDEDEKKSKKKKGERESSSNKREEKFEDIFGPLSDDSEKAAISKWQVSQVYGSDSESERENIRKKEKKRREKKLREQLDEAGRALEAKLLDTSEEVTEEPIKTKKKKRKKSRDEKIKHHRIIDEDRLPPLFSASTEQDSKSECKRTETENVKEPEPEVKIDTERKIFVEKEGEENKMETDSEENMNKDEIAMPRQHSSSLSSLLDSPPAQPTPPKKPDIPGFGIDVDETIHETAVKSISEANTEDSPLAQDKYDEKPKQEDAASSDKPTPVISQEETEDAVAALLMEDTFGSGFERYSEDTSKPDTPVSEPDLQIDTDTEDTFDPIDFSKTARSPEPAAIPFCQNNDTREGLEERIMSLACSTEASLKEPEKTQTPSVPDLKKDSPSDKRDMDTTEADKTSEKLTVLRTPVVEHNKSEETTKIIPKEQNPLILNEDKPIEIEDDDEEEMFLTTNRKETNSNVKIETSFSPSDAGKSSELVEKLDSPVKLDEKEACIPKQIDNLPVAAPLSQCAPNSQLQSKQQQEHIHQSQKEQLQHLHQQKEQVHQPKEQLQKTHEQHQMQTRQPEQQSQTQRQPQQQSQTQLQLLQQSQVQHQSQQQLQNHQQPLQTQHQSQQLQTLQSQQPHSQQKQQYQHQLLQKHQQLNTQQQLHPQQMLPQQQQHLPPQQQQQQLPLQQQQQHLLHQQPQVIKPVLLEKTAEQSNNTSATPTSFQKTEKIVHQQAILHHNTVLVNQAQPQPQTAQVVKPLSVQVINSPVIKPLDQTVVKQNPVPPKLSSPSGVLTTNTSQPTSVLQTKPTNQSVPKPPLHHIQSFQGRMPSPLPPLVPPHLPVKPSVQLTLQAPQLTPLVKAGLATSPRPLPVPVHTIQNPPNQKQLHVVTQNLQHSPQPVSPQNLKVIRPAQNPSPNMRLPLPLQQQTTIRPPNTVIPLLQTVNTGEASLNKQYHVRPPQHLTSTHLLHCASQVPHPEKVMNLSPSVPFQNSPVALTQKTTNVIAIKSNETLCKPLFSPENNIQTNQQNNERHIELSSGVLQDTKSVVQSPKIQINSCEQPGNDVPLPLKKANVEEAQQIRPLLVETKLIKTTNMDESKPLNAVIQDLTLRATSKALAKMPSCDTNTEIKAETQRPIEQVVRELQLRKKGTVIPPDSEKSTVLHESKIKVENEESSDVRLEMNPSLQNDEGKTLIKKESIVTSEIKKKAEEPIKVEVKEENEMADESPIEPLPKEEPKTEKEEVPSTPTVIKTEIKQNTPETPESITPKSSKDSEAEIPSSEERVIPNEKSNPPSSSGRGRGGRRRKLGRGGASGVVTRRGGRHAATAVSSVPPARPQVPADVYEFRDDSEEERPRLILTIKPEQPSLPSSQVPSTRKSRRLQEKDGTRSIIDDSVEDIIRGPGRPSRRATRSSAPLLSTPVVETTRKSPRRKQPAVAHQPSVDSSPAPQPAASPQQAPSSTQPAVHTQQPPATSAQEPPPSVQPSPPSCSPTPLPAQSQLQPQPGVQSMQQKQPEPEVMQTPQPLLQKEPRLQSPLQPLPQAQPQPVLQQQPLPLSQLPVVSQAQQIVKPIQKQPLLSKPEIKVGPIMQQRPGEPTTLIDPVTGLLIPMREGEEGQYIPVGGGDGGEPPPEKRMRIDEGITKAPVAAIRPSVVRPPQHQPHSLQKPASPPQLPQKPVVNSTIPRPPKAHLLQAVAAERAKIIPRPRPKLIPPQTQPIQAPKPPTPMTPKAHILQAIGNAQAREGVIGSPAPHQGSILTGSVASPPLRVHPQPMVTGASSTRFVVKEPGGRLGPEGGCIVVPSASPQPPPRGQVMQAGLPVPAYEASLGDVVQHVSGYGHHIQPAHYVHPQLMYQQYLREAALGQSPYHRGPGGVKEVDDPVIRGSPPLELRRRASPHDRTTDSPQVATLYGRAHLYPPPAHRPAPATRHQVATPPHASQVPPQGDSLLVLLQRYPVMWQGLLALKNDQAAVQMHFVFGNPTVARDSLPCNSDGTTPPLRISQRMRLEPTQLDGVARKMQMDNEHCMLLALPCGRDHLDVLQQSNNLTSGFITYLQQKQAAGIVNIAAPGSQQAAYVVHIFPASEFANDSLARIAPDLLHRVTDIAHLLIVIATV